MTGLDSSEVTFEKSWYLHVDAKSLAIEDSTGLQGMFDWMQENWWVPFIVAILLLVLFIGLNENTRNSFVEWRLERRLEAGESEIFEAEILPEVTPIHSSQSPVPAATAKSRRAAPELTTSSAATVELVEVETAEVVNAEEVVEAEVVEAEVVNAEVVNAEVVEGDGVTAEVITVVEVESPAEEGSEEVEAVAADAEEVTPEEVEAVEVENVETESDDEAEAVDDTSDDDDDEELDAFLADFEDDEF